MHKGVLLVERDTEMAQLLVLVLIDLPFIPQYSFLRVFPSNGHLYFSLTIPERVCLLLAPSISP